MISLELDTQDIRFYLANALGHDFIHDMNMSSSMGRRRWEKVKDTALVLLEKIVTKNEDSVNQNLLSVFNAVSPPFQRGGTGSQTMLDTRMMNIFRSPVRETNQSVSYFSSAIKDLKDIFQESAPEKFERYFFKIFLSFYRNIVLDHIKKSESQPMNFLSTIFGLTILNTEISGVLKENISISGTIDLILKKIVLLLFFITTPSYNQIDYKISLDSIQNNNDNIDVFVGETMFYLFGLIENPNRVKTIEEVERLFATYIEELQEETNENQMRGGTMTASDIDISPIVREINSIISPPLITVFANRNVDNTENKKKQIDDVIQRVFPRIGNIDTHIDALLSQKRITRVTAESFVRKMKTIYAVKLEDEEAKIKDIKSMNHINRVFANNALKIIGYEEGEENQEYFSPILKTQIEILNDIKNKKNKGGKIDSTLLESVMLHIDETQTNARDSIGNLNNKYIINNASSLTEEDKPSVICPITSVIDSMYNCPRIEMDNTGITNNNIIVSLQNESGDYSYSYQLIKQNTRDNYELSISWKSPNQSYNGSSTISFKLSDNNILTASSVLKRTLEFLITKANEQTGITTDFWEDIINSTRDSLELMKYGLIKSGGDIGQELTALTIQTNNPIVYYANDRPSGCRFVFLKHAIQNPQNNAVGGYSGLFIQYLSIFQRDNSQKRQINDDNDYSNNNTKRQRIRGGTKKRRQSRKQNCRRKTRKHKHKK